MIIYRISNLVNEKCYIGQTVSKLNRRYPGGPHKNPSNDHLANAYMKYGKDNFKIEPILNCDSVEALNYWEQYFIELFKSWHKDSGYNKEFGGANQRYTPERLERHSHQLKNYVANNPQERDRLAAMNIAHWIKPESKAAKSAQMQELCGGKERRLLMSKVQGTEAFNCYTAETGAFVGNWDTISFCCEDLTLARRNVSQCLKGTRKTHRGLIFTRKTLSANYDFSKGSPEFVNERVAIDKEVIRQRNLKHANHLAKTPIILPKPTGIVVLSPEGAYIGTWSNQRDCAKDLGVNYSNLSSWITGWKTTKRYIFKRVA